MNVTSEILFYLFSREYPVSMDTKAAGHKISSLKCFHSEKTISKNTLYCLSENEYRRLPEAKKKALSSVFLTSSSSEQNAANDPAVRRRNAEPDTGIPGQKAVKSPAAPDRTNLALTSAFRDPEELLDVLSALYNRLLLEENELLLATLDRDRIEDVFGFGSKWFPWEYSIVDIDMRLIYRTENLHKVLGGQKVDRIPQESIQDLILSKEFHDAAKKKDAFYQSMTFNNLTAFARNILPDNQYAGRIVMFLEEKNGHVSIGAEELFVFFTDCIMEALRRTGRLATRPQNDPLRALCRSLYNHEQIPEHSIRTVLNRVGWQKNHTYSVICFRFLPDSVWEAQLETTLPYLADELENEWPHSCALNTGHEIHLVLNHSLSTVGSDLTKLHQQFAYFVRDHICIAGVSSLFHDFSLLADAKLCADAALSLGQEDAPHLWYHLFDDYRLSFMKEALKKVVSPAFLSHPALNTLKEYDRKNHTELSQTLKAYLDNDRNMTTAADSIYVHRTTFCRRMDHIRKLTGLDLNNPDTLVLLELSYQFEE